VGFDDDLIHHKTITEDIKQQIVIIDFVEVKYLQLQSDLLLLIS
jgi:hypothetical protein